MSVVGALCGLGLRITFGEAGEAIQDLVHSVRDRFEDHSQALPRALERANDQAWQALAVALAGDGFLPGREGEHDRRLALGLQVERLALKVLGLALVGRLGIVRARPAQQQREREQDRHDTQAPAFPVHRSAS